jgi:hypothetical protein
VVGRGRGSARRARVGMDVRRRWDMRSARSTRVRSGRVHDRGRRKSRQRRREARLVARVHCRCRCRCRGCRRCLRPSDARVLLCRHAAGEVRVRLGGRGRRFRRCRRSGGRGVRVRRGEVDAAGARCLCRVSREGVPRSTGGVRRRWRHCCARRLRRSRANSRPRGGIAPRQARLVCRRPVHAVDRVRRRRRASRCGGRDWPGGRCHWSGCGEPEQLGRAPGRGGRLPGVVGARRRRDRGRGRGTRRRRSCVRSVRGWTDGCSRGCRRRGGLGRSGMRRGRGDGEHVAEAA